MTIKFNMHGTMSYIGTRLPTEEEMEKCHKIHMKIEDEWQPYYMCWQENKEAYKDVAPTFDKTKVKSTETTALRVRQLDSATGQFRGFCRVVASVMSLGAFAMSI